MEYKNYRKYDDVPDCVGYIAHMHDPTNFDIDIALPSNYKKRYSQVITANYSFSYLPETDFIYGHDPGKIVKQYSSAYRCRLRGVGACKNGNRLLQNEIMAAVAKLFHSTDMYGCICVSDIDVYQRLLVDIKCAEVNLRDFILGMDPQGLCFYKYDIARR